jgi:hypothetical protein
MLLSDRYAVHNRVPKRPKLLLQHICLFSGARAPGLLANYEDSRSKFVHEALVEVPLPEVETPQVTVKMT